jgi:TfoX/Sxy family transcriptional regulator of competence genes
MIKLFRNIRQNLLNQGKTTKYLKYAVGEIILVVIGILIALQVNNWNIERLNKTEEQRYLKAIKTDLANDALRLKQLVNNIDIQLANLEQTRKGLTSDSIAINQDVAFTTSLVTTFTFVPEKATIDDLKSSGKLNLLENKKVKDTLLSYYNHVDARINALNTSIITYARDIIAPFLMANYTIEYGYPESLITEKSKIVSLTTAQKENQFLNNAVRFRIFILSSLKASYEDLIIRINQFQETLNKEIKT